MEDNDLVETMVAVGQQYPFCGYGAKFFSWINGKKHQPYNSWGNGSAMRVAFVGEFYEDYDEMQKMASKTAEVSHNHPEGIKGAVVTATCIWMANTVSPSRRYMITFCRNIRQTFMSTASGIA